LEVIRNSAKILEYGTQSQLSQLQIQGGVYEFNKKQTSRQELKEQIENVSAPFMQMILDKGVNLEIM